MQIRFLRPREQGRVQRALAAADNRAKADDQEFVEIVSDAVQQLTRLCQPFSRPNFSALVSYFRLPNCQKVNDECSLYSRGKRGDRRGDRITRSADFPASKSGHPAWI